MELKFYKKWCYIFVALQFFTLGVASYAYLQKIDPLCVKVEAKYQYILQHGEDVEPEVYPNPAEGND